MQNPTITGSGSHTALLSQQSLIFIKTSAHKGLRKAQKNKQNIWNYFFLSPIERQITNIWLV